MRGDREATEVIETNARAVGEVSANLHDLFRPDIILLGSLAIHLGEEWVKIVRARFREEALPDSAECPIEPAGLARVYSSAPPWSSPFRRFSFSPSASDPAPGS